MAAIVLNPGMASAEAVVVIPLVETEGNAQASDLLKPTTFSSNAGVGVEGTLEIRANSTLYVNTNGSGDFTHRPVWPEELSLRYNPYFNPDFSMQSSKNTL